MSLRSPRGLVILFSVIVGICEFISAPMIEFWGFALAFAVLYLVGAFLVYRGRLVAGSILVSALSLFELANYPFWAKSGAFDWAFDTFAAVAAAATLVSVVWMLASRRRTAVSG